ncbi:MAG: cellulose synthase catalytic subunit [Chloroflexota bacterium]
MIQILISNLTRSIISCFIHLRPSVRHTINVLDMALLGAGIGAILFYYLWWFQRLSFASPLLILGCLVALFYGCFQLLGNWILYAVGPNPSQDEVPQNDSPTVDVLIPVLNESFEMVETCLLAVKKMEGEYTIWLLDDGEDSKLRKLAQDLQIGYLTRQGVDDAKAGNMNAALPRIHGEIVAIFDIDHVPVPNYLTKTIGYFADNRVGFVQVMPTFSNDDESWLAQAAIDTSLDFYNPTSKGMDGLNCVTKMGSNCLIRRRTLDEIGGYQVGLAEDLATSIKIHATGWESRYVAEPLAPGLAPATLSAWYTQQFKWSRGVFEVMLTSFSLINQLRWGQRICYAVRTTKYWIGLVIALHLAAIIIALFSADNALLESLNGYMLHLVPLAVADSLIRVYMFRKWRHPSIEASSFRQAVILIYATWPIYTLAWFMSLLRIPLKYRLTPKSKTDSPPWSLFTLHLMTGFILLAGIIYTFSVLGHIPLVVLSFAMSQLIIHLFIIGLWRPTKYSQKMGEIDEVPSVLSSV